MIITISVFTCINVLCSQSLDKVEYNVCPFECCQFGEWICKDLINVYKKEGDLSSFSYQLLLDDTITAVTGNIHYERIGKVVMTKPIYSFQPYDTLLATRCCGEEGFYLYKDGKEYCTEIFWPFYHYDDDLDEEFYYNRYQKELQDSTYSGIMIERPQIIWWVKIIHNGTDGWICLRNRTPFCFDAKERIWGSDGCG